MTIRLVLIETSGNQAYVFATNKLRENVGASELTARVGTEYVLKAIRDAGGPDLWHESMPEVRGALKDPTRNLPVDEKNPVEVIVAASGKAILLVKDESLGKQIVREVTLRALKEAPGLEVRGVVSQEFDFENVEIHEKIKTIHREFEAVRSRLPGPSARFQRLPIIAECATSGLPAVRIARTDDDITKDEQKEYSAPVFAKLNARKQWKSRLDGILNHHNASAKLPDATTDLEKLGCDWLAIVHADGNGLGQVFLKFEANTSGNRDYIEKLRNFSLALDECTEKAFCQALHVLTIPKNAPRQFKLKNPDFKPVVPLVLGGDDLTVVCDGRQALQFTKKFIDCFEEETAGHEDVKRIMPKGVTSCAGVAIVKPHFPFFAGYHLAEELLQSAKKLGKKSELHMLSAIDYHILYDSSGPDLVRLRRELTSDDGKTLLVGRPYVTTADKGPVNRRWSDLCCRITSVLARDEDDRRRLPNSMLHDLREALFLRKETADARLKLVIERYRKEGLDKLLGDPKIDSLYWMDNDSHRTALLDAIDTAEFWEAQS
ncbi:MAG: hypothetical protein R3B84_14000 [Zavarzinella sp.]